MANTIAAFAHKRDWLADYLFDVRFLLHDTSGNYFQDSELVSYINEARTTVCVDTGCLRQLLTVTLPGGVEAFPIGGVYAIPANTPPPMGGVAPYRLVSGSGAAATAGVGSVPLSVTVTAPGQYWQPPLVTFDAGVPTLALAASATAILDSGGGVASVYVDFDNGSYNNTNVTPNVVFTAVGQPAQLTVDGNGHLQLTSFGAGQSNGVYIEDAAGTLTALPGVSMLDSRIAAVDQVTCIWGSQRVPLRNYAYSDFSVQVRGIVGFQSVPVAFAVFADTLYIGPVPNQSYQYELDCILYPQPLLDFASMGEINDRSAIMAVKYYAAFRARMSQGDEAAAQAFFQLYGERIGWSANRFTTRLSQLWPDNENLE